jgi:hypothetical protein
MNTVTLTQPQKNLVAKLQNRYGLEILPVDMSLHTNLANGQEFGPFDPLVSALLTFVLTSYRNYSMNGRRMSFNGIEVPISLYDRTKYLVLALDKKAYYDLID